MMSAAAAMQATTIITVVTYSNAGFHNHQGFYQQSRGLTCPRCDVTEGWR